MNPERFLAGARFNIVFLMLLFSIMSYFYRTIMSVAGTWHYERVLPFRKREWVWSILRLLLGDALMMIPGGQLADRFGPGAR